LNSATRPTHLNSRKGSHPDPETVPDPEADPITHADVGICRLDSATSDWFHGEIPAGVQ